MCRRLEQVHGVRVLLATLAGGRLYGISSPSSDYDVRFVYCHPIEWYASEARRFLFSFWMP
jgi:uncharacterized protein